MIRLALDRLAEWTGGRLHGGAARGAFRGVAIDSRAVRPDNLFVALRGPNFDGHDFGAEAVAAGAAALLVERPLDVAVAQVIVDDTVAALGHLGATWRLHFHGPLIAVTGSNGKTTVKQCLAAIAASAGPVLATRGNLNNHIGVPLMLCELDPAAHRAAVIELGANHPGEIAYLAHLARPRVGVVTNAAPAHLEGFGSIAGVARAKGELYAALAADAVAAIPVDEEHGPLWHWLAGARRCIDYAADGAAEVCVRAAAEGVELEVQGGVRAVAFPLPGAHNRHNAAAAAAAAWGAGFDLEAIAAGLAAVEPVAGRLVRRAGLAGATLFDDSYNANPGSFAAGLAVLAEQPGRRWAVVGEMAELGAATAEAHRRLGSDLRQAGVERVWAYGPSARETVAGFGAEAEVVEDLDTLAQRLRQELAADVSLLVKGSRSNRLERLVERLLAAEQSVADAGNGG